ncbi:MAG: hypothetical protein R2729_07735 [Bryobacteraceae bacterium]
MKFADSKTFNSAAGAWRLPDGTAMADFAMSRGGWAAALLLPVSPLAGFTPVRAYPGRASNAPSGQGPAVIGVMTAPAGESRR